MNYRTLAIKGVAWTSVLRGVVRASTIIKIAILARLLSPNEFGTVGIAILVLGLLEILTETGINVFLVQQKKDWIKYLNTSWVVSIFRGFLIFAVILSSSTFIARFFNNQSVLPLLYLTAIVPVIRGFINPACIRLLKELKFEKEFFYRATISAAEIISAILIVNLTHTGIGIVASVVVSALTELTLSWIFINPRPKLAINTTQLREILTHGKWITAFGLFDYIYTQGDNIVVGKLLNSTSLGLYQNAYKLATLPMTEISDVYHRVNFPIFSSLLAQEKSVRSTTIKISLIVSIIAALTGIFIYLFAQPLVILMLGDGWLSAVPIVKTLAFVASFRGISFAFNPLFMASGKQHLVTQIIGLNAIVLCVLIIPMTSQYGVVGAAISSLIAALSSVPLAWFYGIRMIKRMK